MDTCFARYRPTLGGVEIMDNSKQRTTKPAKDVATNMT
jgi:hypothetical protein